MNSKTLEKSLKAIADKSRLQIIELIHQGERCGCELLSNLKITQPTLSHHLKVLSDAGIIMGIRHQNKIQYTVQINKIAEIVTALQSLLATVVICEE